MGSGGRPRKPTALKVLHGTTRKDRANPHEPKPPTKAPSCPTWLCAEAKREWQRVIRLLLKFDLISEFDRAALAQYCQAYGRWQDAEKQVREHGSVLETQNGYQYPNPWESIAQKWFDRCRQMSGLFGFTPADRSKVGTAPLTGDGDEDDATGAFLFNPTARRA